MKTLVIQSSILGENSKSRVLVDALLNKLAASDKQSTVTTRDLGQSALPYFDGVVVGALFTPPDSRSAEQVEIAKEADALTAELLDAERIIIGVPIYNFGIPAQLKSYIDYLARAGVTFKYNSDGSSTGLVTGKKVYVVSARGGKAEGTPTDTVTPYLQTMLGFLGMTEVTFIAVEGQAMGSDVAAEGVARAEAKIATLA